MRIRQVSSGQPVILFLTVVHNAVCLGMGGRRESTKCMTYCCLLEFTPANSKDLITCGYQLNDLNPLQMVQETYSEVS